MKFKIYYGKFKNYEFNKEKFMFEIKSYFLNKLIKVKISIINMMFGVIGLCKSLK